MYSERILKVIRYQNVLDLPSRAHIYPRNLPLADFRQHLTELPSQFEMASLESALDFINGEYRPRRDLCLLTFDGGVRSHLSGVVPLLRQYRIRGVFFLITSCVSGHAAAPCHLSDLLLSTLGVQRYSGLLMRAVPPRQGVPALSAAYDAAARQEGSWDTSELDRFQYMFHSHLDPVLRDATVRELFQQHIGSEAEFVRTQYANWDEVRAMQKGGMCMGGAGHQHQALADFSPPEMNKDLETCRALLAQHLGPQAMWPFCYPGGRLDSFHVRAVRKLQSLGYRCAFASEGGNNQSGADLFTLRRFDSHRALFREAVA